MGIGIKQAVECAIVERKCFGDERLVDIAGGQWRSSQNFGFVFDENADAFFDVGPVQDFFTHAVGSFTVAVHDVVILNNVFANIEVVAFDLLLGGF